MTSEHDKYALEYDEQVRNYHCHIADVLFGLSYEYIKHGESLLDVGIGTGISSALFHQAGLQVYGIDGSGEMLRICRDKGLTVELTERDLLAFPWPYQNGVFDHVISCGVFHFIRDLNRIFKEVSRIQKIGGTFAFTVLIEDEKLFGKSNYHMRVEDGLSVYSHKTDYISRLLIMHGYTRKKELISCVGPSQFKVLVARRGEQ